MRTALALRLRCSMCALVLVSVWGVSVIMNTLVVPCTQYHMKVCVILCP